MGFEDDLTVQETMSNNYLAKWFKFIDGAYHHHNEDAIVEYVFGNCKVSFKTLKPARTFKINGEYEFLCNLDKSLRDYVDESPMDYAMATYGFEKVETIEKISYIKRVGESLINISEYETLIGTSDYYMTTLRTGYYNARSLEMCIRNAMDELWVIESKLVQYLRAHLARVNGTKFERELPSNSHLCISIDNFRVSVCIEYHGAEKNFYIGMKEHRALEKIRDFLESSLIEADSAKLELDDLIKY